MPTIQERITALVIWLIVVLATFLYARYYYHLKTVGEIILALSPAIIFFTGGILIFSRDRKKIKRAKQKNELKRTVELEWGQVIKHDALTYLTPVIILSIPFFFGQLPNITSVTQASATFLALSYLKFIYWGGNCKNLVIIKRVEGEGELLQPCEANSTRKRSPEGKTIKIYVNTLNECCLSWPVGLWGVSHRPGEGRSWSHVWTCSNPGVIQHTGFQTRVQKTNTARRASDHLPCIPANDLGPPLEGDYAQCAIATKRLR
ncbi:MAG: hypothetical protein CMI53_00215 [Parcubacteria group bacterium]|jgi:hypothetical protein|nr:hypothetical protein [Parcubacteria group bacterium]|tara:strand:+ start:10180 stop:10962 length:783 start_codon:yes stop_codon:yes gene_type:complete